jgi:hypothetical protein
MPAQHDEPRPSDEDQLDELPPLDGDARDAPEAEPTFEDLLEEVDGEATLDDATAEDDAPSDASELDLTDDGGGWMDEPADSPELDLGDVGVSDFGEEEEEEGATRGPGAAGGNAPHAAPLLGQRGEEGDDIGIGDEDFGFSNSPERGDLDGGDEGPLDGDEELREADLPDLDADDEGEVDEAVLIDAGFAADEPLGLPWSGEPWSRVGAPVALATATAVACAPRGALVAGRSEVGAGELSQVDLEGACQSLPAEGIDPAAVRALAVEADLVAAVLEDGRAFVSRDGGARFEPVAEAVAVAEAAFAPSPPSRTLWLRTRAGGLLARPEGSPTLQRCAVPGAVGALARDGAAGVAALVVDDGGRPLAVLRASRAGPLHPQAIDDGPEGRSPALLAARGEHVAYAASAAAWCAAAEAVLARRTHGTGA